MRNYFSFAFDFEQEMPSQQPKSAKKGSESYLMFGPNHILLSMRWNDGRSPGHEKVCRWFLYKYKQLLAPSKLRNRVVLGNRVFLGKFSKMKFRFSKLVKSIVFRPLHKK